MVGVVQSGYVWYSTTEPTLSGKPNHTCLLGERAVEYQLSLEFYIAHSCTDLVGIQIRRWMWRRCWRGWYICGNGSLSVLSRESSKLFCSLVRVVSFCFCLSCLVTNRLLKDFMIKSGMYIHKSKRNNLLKSQKKFPDEGDRTDSEPDCIITTNFCHNTIHTYTYLYPLHTPRGAAML